MVVNPGTFIISVEAFISLEIEALGAKKRSSCKPVDCSDKVHKLRKVIVNIADVR